MDSNQYNRMRYNRKKQWFRFCLGLMQFREMPILNLMWFIVIIVARYAYKGKNILVLLFDMPLISMKILDTCLSIGIVIFVISIVVVMMQEIGELVAREDEAKISLAFENKDFKCGEPILIYKKEIKKKRITIREFYTTIPMKRWQEEKEAICERMNAHLIKSIKYGGKDNNNGNYIVIESAEGRKPTERGVLYDDTF